jgi:general secretion pathway protein G
MTAIRNNRARKTGFTLIEILIVVIILGILAAIVIPQFSSASNDARRSNVQTTAQTLRSQIALYRLQHQDKLPVVTGTGGADFWEHMTKYSNEAGTSLSTAKVVSTGIKFGPYMQQIAPNALNSLTTVVDGTSNAAAGYVYDYGTTGIGSGQIWGTDADGSTLVKP